MRSVILRKSSLSCFFISIFTAILLSCVIYGIVYSNNSNNSDNPDKIYTCTLSVSCSTLLDNTDKLSESKREFVPSDGIILPTTSIPFSENETAFDVVRRAFQDAKIHFEFSNTPLHNSVYIEGIANIYEFDAGELSGWVYRVNGEFPQYSLSQYTLADGDIIELLFTCDLGKDVGNDYMPEN